MTPRGGAGGAGGVSDGSPSTEGNHPGEDSGCGCRVAGQGSEPFGGAGAMIALLVAFGSRRRRGR
jgi:MYXO-CTERM domain-containing protein